MEDIFKMDECGMVSDEGDTIYWNYKGTLLNGHIFDQGKFKATLGQQHVIKGVDVGMRGLCVGDKRLMTIYPGWAYGDEGVPGTIPPKATLRFEVELTGIDRPGIGSENLEDILKKSGGVSKSKKIKVRINRNRQKVASSLKNLLVFTNFLLVNFAKNTDWKGLQMLSY